MSTPLITLVYEGRLGSGRADSTYVLENAESFSQYCQVRILTSRRSRWHIPDNITTKYQVIELGRVFNPKTLFQSIKGQLGFSWQIRKLLKSEKSRPEVLIFHDWWPTQLIRFLGRARRERLIYLEVHNQLPLNLIWKYSFRHLDCFIATNTKKANELKSHFSEKVITEKNCVRFSRYNFQNSKTDQSQNFSRAALNKVVVGYTGSLGEEKNPRLFIDLVKHSPQFDFYIAGKVPGEYSTQLASLPNIKYFGILDRESIPILQMNCDILLVTLDPTNMVSAEYTSTMKLLEYIAAKRPIVAPLLPSILEILTANEFYGYKSDSYQDCQRAISMVLTDLDERKRMPLPSRQYEYSWDERSKRLLERARIDFGKRLN